MPSEIVWATDRLELVLEHDPGPVRLVGLRVDTVDLPLPHEGLPIVEVGLVGRGRSWSSRRYVDSVAGSALSYVGHTTDGDSSRQVLEITAVDEDSGLSATTRFESFRTVAAVRISTSLTGTGREAARVEWVSSLVLGGLPGADTGPVLWWADNDWLAEGRWQHAPVRSVLPDLSRAAHQHDPRGNFSRTASGAWSSDGSLPMGGLELQPGGMALCWQIEHNGPWHWQVGERAGGLYLAALGPVEDQHQWSVRLGPGDRFDTVPATLSLATGGGFEAAVGELTRWRRATRRPSPDHTELPVIFNDYMNTLMGDPTTAKLLPLIDAAAEVGAETFCIDAGWYDDDIAGWWDSVGAWEPAASRFPGGLAEVLDRIRGHGMTAGLWVEPEVVGVRSPLARTLPPEAFFQRGGHRVVEHGRYSLDLRHPAARGHLDGVLDRLVDDLGVRYFKFDYNINPGAGTDVDSQSVGDGLLGHNRAHLRWLDDLLDRHPGITIENCSSGGMRTDYALLSRLQLQSCTDQQDPRRYPPISAAAHAATTPEQAANWAYPQPSFSDDEIAFTLCNSLLGRIHLSGRLDQMNAHQKALVAEALTAYKGYRHLIADALPWWPLGLPGWDDGWIAHGLSTSAGLYLVLWRRDTQQTTTTVPLPRGADHGPAAVVFPSNSDVGLDVRGNEESGWALEISVPRTNQSVLIHVA